LDELITQVDSIDVLDWSGAIVASGPPRQVLERHAGTLGELGVWVPQVCELANALREDGIELDPYPLTVGEAASALDKLLDRGQGSGVRDQSALASLIPDPRSLSPIPAVEVNDLAYAYPDGNVALRRASLRVDEGDFYAIVGPNGSGKTTLA